MTESEKRQIAAEYVGHLLLSALEQMCGNAHQTSSCGEIVERKECKSDRSREKQIVAGNLVSLSELRRHIPPANGNAKQCSPERVRQFIEHEAWPDPVEESGEPGTTTYRAKWLEEDIVDAINVVQHFLDSERDPYGLPD